MPRWRFGCRCRSALAAARPRRQIFVDWPVAHVRQQVETAALFHKLGHRARRITEIAEMPRASWTGAHARRDTILRRESFIIDTIDAERALFHRAVVVVVLPRAIGAGPGAQLAADASVGI